MRRNALTIVTITLVIPLVSFAAATPPLAGALEVTTARRQTPAEKPAEAPKQAEAEKQKEAEEKKKLAEKPPDPPPDTTGPIVESIDNVTRPTESQVRLRDVLRLKIKNLKDWRTKNPDVVLHLYLAGVPLKNVTAMPTQVDPADPLDLAAVLVKLEPENDRDGVVRKAWVQVLQTAIKLSNETAATRKRIRISVGPPDAVPFKSDQTIELKVFRGYTWAVIAFLVVVLIAIVVLARNSNILRDSNGSATPPYSLAKHQMAVWFVVVIGSYLCIWLVTGFINAVSPTALALFGISATTGLAAVAMDNSKRTEAFKARAASTAERDALEKTLNDPASGLLTQLKSATPGSPAAVELTATVTPKLARLQELKTLLAAPPPAVQTNQIWYIDLLSDENGVSFHRLQMVVWTLVLAAVFVRAVYTDILMPEFDATLLGLMGISSGTYIGFKFPERPA